MPSRQRGDIRRRIRADHDVHPAACPHGGHHRLRRIPAHHRGETPGRPLPDGTGATAPHRRRGRGLQGHPRSAGPHGRSRRPEPDPPRWPRHLPAPVRALTRRVRPRAAQAVRLLLHAGRGRRAVGSTHRRRPRHPPRQAARICRPGCLHSRSCHGKREPTRTRYSSASPRTPPPWAGPALSPAPSPGPPNGIVGLEPQRAPTPWPDCGPPSS